LEWKRNNILGFFGAMTSTTGVITEYFNIYTKFKYIVINNILLSFTQWAIHFSNIVNKRICLQNEQSTGQVQILGGDNLKNLSGKVGNISYS